MLYRFLFLLFRVPLFSVASSAIIALASTGQTVVYPIDPMQRGLELVNTFNSLVADNSGISFPEVALQTTLPGGSPYTTYSYIVNGFIPYIQKLTPTTNDTLLIVTYLPSTSAFPQYIVLPVEQTVALLYFPTFYNASPGPFTSTYPTGIIPYFSVDPVQRAADIVDAVTKLIDPAGSFRTGTSQVWMQVNLTGPFNLNVPAIRSGLLQNITSIATVATISGTAKTTLIKVVFAPPNQTNLTIFVTPEQVQQIIFIRNPPYI